MSDLMKVVRKETLAGTALNQHRCHWSEKDKQQALDYLEIHHLTPAGLSDADAEKLNSGLGRSLTLPSWRRTFQRWMSSDSILYRPTDAALELQELREFRRRVEKVCVHLNEPKCRVGNEVVAAYLAGQSAEALFEAACK